MRAPGFLGAFFVASLLASPAFAGDSVDRAAATELFNAGRDAMKAGDFATACPKLAESVRLEATVGALAKLAECEEHERRLVDAYGHWAQALNLARGTNDDRVADVERELGRLDAVVPKLRVVSAGALPAGTSIHVDAVELGPASLGVALPVASGAHAVTASAPHRHAWSTQVETALDGNTTTVTVPELEPEPDVVAPAPAATAPWPATPPRPQRHDAAFPWRAVGFATALTGVTALAVGAAVGLEAMHQRDVAGCPDNVCPSDGAAGTLRAAKSTADVSTVLFVVGAVATGGGGVMWWLGGNRDRGVAVLVTPAGVAGRF